MKTGYVIRDQETPHFITATVVDWIDIFTRKSYRDILLNCFDFCIKNKGMVLFGYVIMSNHIHFIVQSKDGKLSDLIRDFKKFTATLILKQLQTEPESRGNGSWSGLGKPQKPTQEIRIFRLGNHAEEIFTLKLMSAKLNYIHLNPVRAGIVEKANHYLYSSASNYSSGKGLIDIEIAESGY